MTCRVDWNVRIKRAVTQWFNEPTATVNLTNIQEEARTRESQGISKDRVDPCCSYSRSQEDHEKTEPTCSLHKELACSYCQGQVRAVKETVEVYFDTVVSFIVIILVSRGLAANSEQQQQCLAAIRGLVD